MNEAAMRVLMLPYLAFKDFRQSSGIIHQAELAKALAAGLPTGGVTVLMPKRQGGWDYPVNELFGGIDNLTVHEVEFLRDYDLAAGAITPDLAAVLTPERSPVPFDVVFSGVPAAALGLRRWLVRVGFARTAIPVVNYYDIVKVPEELKDRGGVSPELVHELSLLETAGAARSYSIVHTESELESLRGNLRRLLAPSLALETFHDRLFQIDRPYAPPRGPVRRSRQGEEFRIFVGRSFGPGSEEAGYMTTPLMEAVGYLRAQGCPVRLVLATQSEITSWARPWLQRDGVELVHRRPRAEVLDLLYACELSAYLCDYNGLYMSSIEAITSGSPHIAKRSRWSRGEVETPWMVSEDCCSFAAEVKGKAREQLIAELVALIRQILGDYEAAAGEA
jgi:hypothetical protein